MKISKQEQSKLIGIIEKIDMLKEYLHNTSVNNDRNNLNEYYIYVSQIKKIIGNFDTDISYTSCLLAKELLCKRLILCTNLLLYSGLVEDRWTLDYKLNRNFNIIKDRMARIDI